MSKGLKSSIPVKHGIPNPAYGQALDLIRNVSQYRELAARVRSEAALLKSKGGKLDMQQLFRQCADVGIKAELNALFVSNTTVPKEQPVLGPPPPTTELYGRFGRNLKITDIGSGNCMKLLRSSGRLTIQAVDPNLTNESRQVLQPFKMTLEAYFRATPDHLDLIYSSFMALPQIPPSERAKLTETDGLHVIPDHFMLVMNKIAIHREDGKLMVRTGVRDYVDYPVEMMGQPLEPGYLLAPTYKSRSLAIKMSSEKQVQTYSPVIDAKPTGYYDLNFNDLGPKFDGVAHELESQEGQCFLVDRAGNQRIGVTDVDFHFCLHLEELDQCYILIRVLSWRGYVPPHSGDMLRYFSERVKIFINEKPILPSPRWIGGPIAEIGPTLRWDVDGVQHQYTPKVDGLISREHGRDHYCKYMWTVDITAGRVPALRDKFEKDGYHLDVDGDFCEGLNECALTRDGSYITLRPVKPRVDKLIETADDTIMFLVDRPTLVETETVTGSYAAY